MRTSNAVADDALPGEGKTVKLARGTWDTGWFQAEIYTRALEELGYRIQGPITLDNPPFYQSVGFGDVDLWVNGWFPLHNTYRDDFEPGARVIGYVAKGGALQGYLIDKKTADQYPQQSDPGRYPQSVPQVDNDGYDIGQSWLDAGQGAGEGRLEDVNGDGQCSKAGDHVIVAVKDGGGALFWLTGRHLPKGLSHRTP